MRLQRPLAVVSIAPLHTGCPALVGLDNDYTSGGGPDSSPEAGNVGDGTVPRDGRAFGDARTGRDAHTKVDAAKDSSSHAHDAATDASPFPGDSSSPLDSAHPDACGASCPCPGGQTRCGSSCVDLQTDPSNCGACGQSCAAASPSSASCADARCIVTLASSGGYGAGITVDATSVYWSNGGAVLKVPLGGGSVTTLESDPSEQPLKVAVTGSSVYWTSFLGQLATTSIGGGAVTTLVSTGLPTPPPYFLTLDASFLYWTTQTDNTIGTVVKRSLAGGAVTTLASGQDLSSDIAVYGGTVFWANAGTGAAGTGSVVALTAAGLTTIAGAQTAPYAVATDGQNVYWTSGTEPGDVLQVDVSGGTITTLATGQAEPSGIAVDGTNVYWANANGNGVMSVPIGGGTAVTVAIPTAAQFVAVDATSIYFTTENATGGVYKVTPK